MSDIVIAWPGMQPPQQVGMQPQQPPEISELEITPSDSNRGGVVEGPLFPAEHISYDGEYGGVGPLSRAQVSWEARHRHYMQLDL